MFPCLHYYFSYLILYVLCVFYGCRTAARGSQALLAVDACPMHKLEDDGTSVLCCCSQSTQKSIFVILMQIVCKFPPKTVRPPPSSSLADSFFLTHVCRLINQEDKRKGTEGNRHRKGIKTGGNVLFLFFFSNGRKGQ